MRVGEELEHAQPGDLEGQRRPDVGQEGALVGQEEAVVRRCVHAPTLSTGFSDIGCRFSDLRVTETSSDVGNPGETVPWQGVRRAHHADRPDARQGRSAPGPAVGGPDPRRPRRRPRLLPGRPRPRPGAAHGREPVAAAHLRPLVRRRADRRAAGRHGPGRARADRRDPRGGLLGTGRGPRRRGRALGRGVLRAPRHRRRAGPLHPPRRGRVRRLGDPGDDVLAHHAGRPRRRTRRRRAVPLHLHRRRRRRARARRGRLGRRHAAPGGGRGPGARRGAPLRRGRPRPGVRGAARDR